MATYSNNVIHNRGNLKTNKGILKKNTHTKENMATSSSGTRGKKRTSRVSFEKKRMDVNGINRLNSRVPENKRGHVLSRIQLKILEWCKSNNFRKLNALTKELFPSDVNCRDAVQNSPLHYACKNGNFLMVKFLCAKGANINIQGKLMDTPLHMAFFSGSLKVSLCSNIKVCLLFAASRRKHKCIEQISTNSNLLCFPENSYIYGVTRSCRSVFRSVSII